MAGDLWRHRLNRLLWDSEVAWPWKFSRLIQIELKTTTSQRRRLGGRLGDGLRRRRARIVRFVNIEEDCVENWCDQQRQHCRERQAEHDAHRHGSEEGISQQRN